MAEQQNNIPDTITIFGKRTSMTKRQFKVLCLCLAAVAAAVVAFVVIFGYFEGWMGGVYALHLYRSDIYDVEAIANEQFSVHFLQTGELNGDCVYVKAGDTDLLIDAGPSRQGSVAVTQYIDRFCTDGVLEYVVATHSDSDHISGFVGTEGIDGVFDKYDCRTIIQFSQANDMTDVYRDFCRKRDEEIAQGARCFTALDCCKELRGAQKQYDLGGGVTMEVLYQEYYETHSETENDYSVCILLKAGDVSCLFTGDLETYGELSLLVNNPDLKDVTLFKAGHHGSGNSSGEALLSRIQPKYVCVCCVAGSVQYTQLSASTFPAQSFVDRVAQHTNNVFVTACAEVKYNSNGYAEDVDCSPFNGDIVFACTDGQITMYFSHSDKKLAQTDWLKQNRQIPLQWSGL